MLAVHDYCFMEYQQYESRKDNHEKQKQDYYASLNEHKRKGGKSIVMAKPDDFKMKPPPILQLTLLKSLMFLRKIELDQTVTLVMARSKVSSLISSHHSTW